MFCKKCGNNVSAGTKYCGKCGERVADIPNGDYSKYVASRSKRFTNYVLDHIFGIIPVFVFVTIWGLVGFINSVTGSEGNIASEITSRIIPFLIGLSVLGVFPFYHVFFEYFWQKTPAKWVTKTKVVKLDGSKPGFWRLMGRNFARWIPFEALSFLFTTYPRGWHDRVSGTMVVPDNYTTHDVLATNPRSSGKLSKTSFVLSVILAILYVLGLLTGGIINSANNNSEVSKDSWVNYVSTEDSFTVLLPKYPTIEKKQDIPIEDSDVTYGYHEYQAVDGKTSYFIFKYAYSGLNIQDEDKALNLLVNGMVNATDAENPISSFGYYKGYRSIDFSFTAKGEMIKGRAMVVGQTPYLLMMDYYPENYKEENYNKFIDSFVINSSQSNNESPLLLRLLPL